jgi:hypothetical protein
MARWLRRDRRAPANLQLESLSMISISRLTAALVLGLGLAAPGHAQVLPRLPLSLEVRGGGGVPTGEFARRQPGVGAELGPRVEGVAVVRLREWLGLFGGVSWAAFSCPACQQGGLSQDLVETGGNAGVQVTPGLRLGGLAPWIRVGAVFQQLEFTGQTESLITPVGTGFQVGGGVTLPVWGPLAVSPALHFRSYAADLDLGGRFDRTIDVSHLTLDVGVALHF